MTQTATITPSPSTRAAIVAAVNARTEAAAAWAIAGGRTNPRRKVAREALAVFDAAIAAVEDATRAHERAVRLLNVGAPERAINDHLTGRA